MRSTLKCDIINPNGSCGVDEMKKKIVYISGAEVFNAADIRAAFDEVRTALNLDADTILFGVPVDNMDEKTESVPDVKIEIEPECVVQESVTEAIKIVPPIESVAAESEITTPVAQETPEPQESDSHVVPILSVLGATTQTTTSTTESPDLADVAQPDNQIDDILNDDMPSATSEQTLEELLERMTPLREDVHLEQAEDEIVDEAPISDSQDDATLENLASEFAKIQDTMPTTKKNPERGKISKLKNILPFKKIKRDDSGLMGDLFGWAGIAANDDDFSMPGFFAGVASKK
jgi:hypothetical protein